MTSLFRSLPSIDRIMSDARVEALVEGYSRQAAVELARSEFVDARKAIADGAPAPTLDELVHGMEKRAASRWGAWPRHIINATGVILHTNLGRAPLSAEATEAVRRAAMGYGDLELDLESGRRGSRQAHVAQLICQLFGGDSALVVNNNASAMLLGLAAVTSGKEVIVSRGEAVEIGGGFRIPDVLRQSGATLVEVGTTNRTYAHDYEAAITENTGALLLVHASNFRVMGFTHSPGIGELVSIGNRRGVPALHDLGSGCLLDTSQFGLAHEPMPQESVRAGVDLSFFSGDKLLGGPQAGIIVGRRDLVNAVSRHPFARAMRIDKLSMAALTATLLHYVRDEATDKIPIWRMIAMSSEDARSTATRWQERLGAGASVMEAQSTIGGGSLPGETLPTWAVSIASDRGGADAMARLLRQGEPPVVGRIEDDRVLLDPRTVLPEEEEALLRTAARAMDAAGQP